MKLCLIYLRTCNGSSTEVCCRVVVLSVKGHLGCALADPSQQHVLVPQALLCILLCCRQVTLPSSNIVMNRQCWSMQLGLRSVRQLRTPQLQPCSSATGQLHSMQWAGKVAPPIQSTTTFTDRGSAICTHFLSTFALRHPAAMFSW